MALRIRMQDWRGKGKRASVEIISVDRFCRLARQLTRLQWTERELLQHLLAIPVMKGECANSGPFTLPYGEPTRDCVIFWLEK